MEYKRLPHKLIGGFIICHQTVNLGFSELVLFYILFSKADLFYSFEGKILHLLKLNSIVAECWKLLDLMYFFLT